MSFLSLRTLPQKKTLMTKEFVTPVDESGLLFCASTTIRLNAEVFEFFKARGKGRQTKINEVLQDYVDAAR